MANPKWATGKLLAGLIVLCAILGCPAYKYARSAGNLRGGTGTEPRTATPRRGGRVVRFPGDRSLGEVFVQDVDADSDIGYFLDRVKQPTWRSLGPAMGELAIPAGKRVQLSVFAGKALRDLSPLSRLRADDVYRLSVSCSQVSGIDPDLAILPHVRGLTGLTILEVGHVDVLPRRLSLLGGLRGLRCLCIWTREAAYERPPAGRSLEDSCLQSLVRLPSLVCLDLASNGITDAGLVHLSSLGSLRELSLFSYRLRGPGLGQLAKLPNLRYLKLYTPEISVSSLQHLKGCASLRKLQLRGLQQVSDADLGALKYLAKLESLDLDGVPISDQALVHLRSLQSLKRLSIGKNPNDPHKIRDDGIRHLVGISSLERVSLWNNDLTDTGLIHLAQLPNLRSLLLPTICLNDPKMDQYYYTDKGLEALSWLQNLEELMIGSPAVTDAGMAHIGKLTNLRILRITAGQVTNDGVAKLSSLKSLETLTLEAPQATVSDLNHLHALTNLKQLDLHSIRQDDAGLDLSQMTNLEELSISLRHYREGQSVRADLFRDEDMACLVNLKHLRWLQGIHGISDAGLKHIAGLTEMERLAVSGTNITDKGLAYLANMKKLNLLHIEGDITGEGLRHLEGLKALNYLNITSESAFSSAALGRLREALPNLVSFTAIP